MSRSEAAKKEVRVFEENAARGVRHAIVFWMLRFFMPLVIGIVVAATGKAAINGGPIQFAIVGGLGAVTVFWLSKFVWRIWKK
jgi:hypothetical protein